MNRVARGGKNIYGFTIGILMLNSQFPRIPGEMGNASTWGFPVFYKVVKGASPQKVVVENDPSLLEPFINAARELEKEGVSAVTTNCGFLAMFQKEMRQAVNIPLFSSTLMMVPMVYSMINPNQKVGIMTVNKSTLGDRIIQGAGCEHIPKVIYGLENEEEFTNMILEDRLEMDVDKCRQEHVKIAKQLVDENPDVGAIVLECTNMPPYSRDIQETTGLPVFDIVTLVNLVHHALVKKTYHGIM
ncbi:MAG: aspartate/glutamate racemase family protein [Desulfobacterales bacterium]|nr:aspartate/glutamate racemase family protein [Desulfobacterales bacterium]